MATLNDRDCFDEESCRYFLREIGARVVPNYPFSYGMEEVHSLIIEEYGDEGIPDVTSLLQEFLEEDDNASGIGDDGDIWRPWRYHWRHRNDNALDPFVPRVGNFILENPTPRYIRRIKAQNFLRRAEYRRRSRATPSRTSREPPEPSSPGAAAQTQSPQSPHDDQLQVEPILTSATYSHQRRRLAMATQARNSDQVLSQTFPAPRDSSSKSLPAGSDSQQSFVEVDRSIPNPNIDERLLVNFEMLDAQSALAHGESGLRGGQIRTFMPVHEGTGSIFRALEDTVNIPGLQVETDSSKATSSPRTPGLPSEEHSHDDHHGNTNYVIPSQTPEPRVANRRARVIDGIIEPFRRRKSVAARRSLEAPAASSPEAGRSSLFRLSWPPARQSSEARRSWVEPLRSLFRSGQSKPPKTLSKHRHSRSVGHGTDAPLSMSTSHQRVTSSTAGTAEASPPVRRFQIDGACDDFPSPSPSHLNKPLPLNPEEIVKSMSSGTRSASIGRSHTLSYQPQSASTTSTKISQVSSKSEFRAVAKDLAMARDPTMHHPDLSPVHEARLNPSKYDPLKSPTSEYSLVSYSSFAQRNPFTQDFVPLTPKPRKSMNAHEHRFHPGVAQSALPPSQSEPNLRDSSPIRNSHAVYYTPPNLPQTPPPFIAERSRSTYGSPRGRSKNREPAEEVDLGQFSSRTGSPVKQVKRSRSPVKRLLGLGKSTPTKEPQTGVAAEPQTPTAASSTKKSSLKQWSDKFRHGFLSVDQEELQREANIEQYLEDPSEPEPPSTFPISLDPAYQARLQADVELLICVSSNKFILHEAQRGRISKDTVTKVRRSWEARNLPQVLEYHYDQATQRELILANFRTVHFNGQFANDPVALNSTMLSWGTLAKEMSVRTFCSADSAIKKQLHDSQRVLEMLGAPLITCLAFEQLHVKALANMTKRQKERLARSQAQHKGHTRNTSNVSKASYSQKGPYPRRDYSVASQYIPNHKRDLSEGSFGVIQGVEQETIEDKIRRMNITPAPPPEVRMRKATGAEGAMMKGSQNSSPSPARYGRNFDSSRGRY